MLYYAKKIIDDLNTYLINEWKENRYRFGSKVFLFLLAMCFILYKQNPVNKPNYFKLINKTWFRLILFIFTMFYIIINLMFPKDTLNHKIIRNCTLDACRAFIIALLSYYDMPLAALWFVFFFSLFFRNWSNFLQEYQA